VLLCSCAGNKKGADAPAAAPEDTGICKTYERGPVTVTVRTNRKEVTIAERLELTLEADAEEGQEVKLPAFGEKLEQFGIVDYRTSQPELVGKGRVRLRKSYVLEPFLSGTYKIPPMTVEFWKKGDDANPHQIETEELEVHVKSLLPEDLSNLTIADIAPPLELPRPPLRWAWGAVAVGVLVVGLLWWLLWWEHRRRRPGEIAHIPAHEIAYMELQRLVSENLIEKGEIKLFYLKISGVLRRYIENRFRLHAPERTTEEFLAELGTGEVLEGKHRTLLRTFLTHCDLVKFAEHQPSTAEIQQTFDSCKAFIAETEEPAPGSTPTHAV